MAEISWTEHGTTRSARWHSENGTPVPERIEIIDDAITADQALRRLRAGTALLWRGDHPGARQLLTAIGRRLDRRRAPTHQDIARLFTAHRAQRAERARLLGGVLVELAPGHRLDLRRAPDVREACREAYGEWEEPTLLALSELLGVLSAHQWQQKGVWIPALEAHIHPRHSVFSPVRAEYVDLVAEAPLPAADGGLRAFDLGTGTGVLAAVLARRGVEHVIASDLNPRAVQCARENAERLGLGERIEVLEADLFPEGRADLIVCNPPWLPGAASSRLELGVYDEDSAMLHGFLAGVEEHLTPGGEAWLVISNLAEHLRLRAPGELAGLIAGAGLEVIGHLSTVARHPRAKDPKDLLHAARSREVTTLWRLRPAGH